MLPAGVGVAIHFILGHEHDLDMIADAGCKFVRMDFYWERTEKTQGQYDWSDYDQLVANLDQRGLRAIFILGYSNPLYEKSVLSPNPITRQNYQNIQSPQHPASVAAYALWAAAAAKHFQGHHIIWEIWNEPNNNFWSPTPNVQQYTTLALATSQAVREADPDATIIGPASSAFPWSFLETFFRSGILEMLDGVSFHPYRSNAPETARTNYHNLRALINRYASPARRGHLPIVCSEWGYSCSNGGVTPQVQAAYLVREQLANFMYGIPITIWYDWKNDGSDPNNGEHNFGTVQTDMNPKPAYSALHTLTHELAGYSILHHFALPDPKDVVLLCADAEGHRKLVAWTAGAPHAVPFTLSPNSTQDLRAITWQGDVHTIKVTSGHLALNLVYAPKYVTVGATLVNGK